jgi:hypothetical protein
MFGTGWISQGNGCTTRDRVLLRDGLDATVGSGCAVTATHWRSVYDGLVSTVRGRVDIDHIVPLANAWVSGASKWSRARRVAFANDLADSQLIAVSVRSTDRRATAAPKNGNTAPPDLVPLRALVGRVKRVWRLTVTGDERTARGSMLARC